MLLIPYMIVLWVLIHKKNTLDSYGPIDPPKMVYSTVTVTPKNGVCSVTVTPKLVYSSVTVWLNSC